LRGVANGIVVHERQSCHPGDRCGIIGFQRRAKFPDENIEFLLQGRRRNGRFRRLGEGRRKLHERGCEHNSQEQLHGSAPGAPRIKFSAPRS